jgi:hypothetical protein
MFETCSSGGAVEDRGGEAGGKTPLCPMKAACPVAPPRLR